MNKAVRAIQKLERAIVLVEWTVVGALLLAMTTLSFTEVLLRNLLHTSFSWSDILLRQGVLWITMLGASLAASDKRHVKLDVLARVIPERAARWVDLATTLLTVTICVLLTKASWIYVVAEREFETKLFGDVAAWPFEAILPAGFALLVIKFLMSLLPEGKTK